jgi:aldehyde dehydrogenase (NAD+)
MYTPPGYLTALSTLTKIKRDINAVLYTEFYSSARKVSSSDIMPLLTSLNNWLLSLPPHLTNFSHVATSHKRAVAALHLRYWYAVILVTRPFLFYSALRGKILTNAAKVKLFEDLSAMNLSAVQKCMQILQQMSADRLLSNLISFDATCILEIIQLCAVRVIEEGDSACLDSIKQCHDILRTMENWGWTKMVIVETTAQLTEQGVLKEEPDQDQTEPTLDTIFQTPGSISGV